MCTLLHTPCSPLLVHESSSFRCSISPSVSLPSISSMFSARLGLIDRFSSLSAVALAPGTLLGRRFSNLISRCVVVRAIRSQKDPKLFRDHTVYREDWKHFIIIQWPIRADPATVPYDASSINVVKRGGTWGRLRPMGRSGPGALGPHGGSVGFWALESLRRGQDKGKIEPHAQGAPWAQGALGPHGA